MIQGKKVVVLLSGGMDSVTALYEARKQHEVVGAISFDYGSRHNHKEIPFAAWHCEQFGIPHETIQLDFVGRLFNSSLLKEGDPIPDGHYEEESMKKTVVPFRNGIMLAIVAGYAESIKAEGIVIAAHAGDHAIYPDCRESFMQAMNTAISEGTYQKVEILRPFIGLDKSGIARLGHQHGIDYAQTWSCYKGGTIHCGTCGTCVERKEAFAMANLADPTAYLN